jgi:magnesium-transporting ATPase (P-type)
MRIANSRTAGLLRQKVADQDAEHGRNEATSDATYNPLQKYTGNYFSAMLWRHVWITDNIPPQCYYT